MEENITYVFRQKDNPNLFLHYAQPPSSTARIVEPGSEIGVVWKENTKENLLAVFSKEHADVIIDSLRPLAVEAVPLDNNDVQVVTNPNTIN